MIAPVQGGSAAGAGIRLRQMSTDGSPDPVRQLMARLAELRPGGASGMAEAGRLLMELARGV